MLQITGAGRNFVMTPGEFRTHPEHEVSVGRHVPARGGRVLHGLGGEIARGEATVITGLGERTARALPGGLLKDGIISSVSEKSAVYLSFPVEQRDLLSLACSRALDSEVALKHLSKPDGRLCHRRSVEGAPVAARILQPVTQFLQHPRSASSARRPAGGKPAEIGAVRRFNVNAADTQALSSSVVTPRPRRRNRQPIKDSS